MWKVQQHRDVKKSLRKLPEPVRRAFTVWIGIAETEGPVGLRAARGFNDEALKGVWKGCRSSRLNKQHRVIYRVENEVVTILVMDVTAHDYRRK